MINFLFLQSPHKGEHTTCHGFPWWLNGKESACNSGAAQMRVRCLGQEDPLEEDMATPSRILA